MPKILGVNFTNKNQQAIADYLSKLMDVELSQLIHVIVANPELLMMINERHGLRKIAKEADLIAPDGIEMVWAAKMLGEEIDEKITTYNTITSLFNKREKERNPLKVYVLGGDRSEVKKAVLNLENTYNYVKVVGYRDGYFNREHELKVVKEIARCKPDLLLASFPSPKQEHFIFNHKERLNAKVAIGIGEVLHIFSGKKKEIPEVMQNLGLSWMFEKRKMKKLMSMSRFVLKIFRLSFSKGK